MANQEHLDRLKQAVAMWTWWRQKHPEIQPDLSRANLSGANLISAYLYEANLVGADLREASSVKILCGQVGVLQTNLRTVRARITVRPAQGKSATVR